MQRALAFTSLTGEPRPIEWLCSHWEEMRRFVARTGTHRAEMAEANARFMAAIEAVGGRWHGYTVVSLARGKVIVTPDVTGAADSRARNPKPHPEGGRRCLACKETKPIDQFYARRRNQPSVRCQRCTIERNRIRRQEKKAEQPGAQP